MILNVSIIKLSFQCPGFFLSSSCFKPKTVYELQTKYSVFSLHLNNSGAQSLGIIKNCLMQVIRRSQ